MRKLLKSMKTLLLIAAGLCVGASNAWGETTYTRVWQDDCSTKTAWKTHGTASENINVTTNNAFVVDDPYVNFRTNSGKDRSNYYSLSSASTQFANSSDYKFEFDLAIYGSNADNHLAHAILLSGSTTVFSIDCTAYNTFKLNAGTAITAQEIDVTNNNKSTRDNTGAATVWYHYTVISNATDGTSLTVEKWDSGAKTSAVAKTTIADGLLNLTELQLNGGSYQQWSIDNLTLSINLEAYTTRAAAAKSVYTSINSQVMNPTVKSTLDAAYNTLNTDYDTDEEIVANISGYATAITSLETANANAQTSINEFVMLNDIIQNAAGVSGYEAPEGAASTYTANPTEDVNVGTLIAAIRAAVVTAGTANENTDISALIINSSFTFGNTLGWNIATSTDDSGINVTDGVLTINPNGNTVSQTVGTLPAGRYKVTAKAWSNGATMYLIVNSTHSDGVVVNGDNVEVSYTFTLGTEQALTIGINSGDQFNSNAFVADGGKWWYRCDNFTLTYLGEDPLEQAKIALNNEITAATAVKNSFTNIVGTAPFLYPIVTYNTLDTELTEAQAVIDANGDVVSAYATAKSELEAAKEAMSSATQILPDADKYYRIYMVSDGVKTDYNLNLTKGILKQQVSVTSAPYPVQIVADGATGRYHIKTPYGNIMQTDNILGVTKAYTNGFDGAEGRCGSIWIELNNDGFVVLHGYRQSGTWYNYTAASASEGAVVDANTGLNGVWAISAAVDVTEVNLAVNATAGWGTFIAPYDNIIPANVKAYTVSHKSGNNVVFAENETGVLSANTPYILSTEASENVSTTFKGIANNSAETYEVNGLVGLLTAGSVPAGSYVLQYQANADGTSFYKTVNGMNGTANRCYLNLAKVSEQAAAGARSTVSFMVFGDDVTGINGVNASETVENAQKGIYNLNGQRVSNPTKGLYIVNGKKVIVK